MRGVQERKRFSVESDVKNVAENACGFGSGKTSPYRVWAEVEGLPEPERRTMIESSS